MKINQNILIDNLLSNFRKNLEQLNKLQNQISTGKKIQVSSDEPLLMHRSLFLKNTILQDEQFTKNLGDNQAMMSINQKAVSDVGDIVNQAKIIALQGANAPSHDARGALSSSVNSLVKNLINVASQHYDGKYIFSGTKINTAPYIDGSDYQYQGDNNKILTNIGLGFTTNMNLTGEEIFGTRYHKIISKNNVLNPTVSLNKSLGINLSSADSRFSFSVSSLPSAAVDYIDPNFDSLQTLAKAISAKRTLTSANIAVNRGTTSLSDVGFTPGQLIINGTTISFGVDINYDGVGDTLNNYTLDTLIREINSKVPGVTAYYRSSDSRMILASEDGTSAITVANGPSGNFASFSGLDVGTDVRTNSQITATITQSGNMILTSQITDEEGRMRITDAVNNGLMYQLGIADENSVVWGKDLGHEQVFYNFEKLKQALQDVSTKNNNLYNLLNAQKESLGLMAQDVITFQAETTTGGSQQLQLQVGNDVHTLEDLSRRLQQFLRVDLQAETAIVRIIDGTLQIINRGGENSQTIENISLTAAGLSGARNNFNQAMATITGTLSDNNSQLHSYQVYTTEVQENISAFIAKMDYLNEKNIALQGEVGTNIQRIEMTKRRLKDSTFNLSMLLSENEDVDMAKAVLEFQKQQTIYEAALGAGARIIQMTLLNFLR